MATAILHEFGRKYAKHRFFAPLHISLDARATVEFATYARNTVDQRSGRGFTQPDFGAIATARANPSAPLVDGQMRRTRVVDGEVYQMRQVQQSFKLSVIRVTDVRHGFFPSYIGSSSRLVFQWVLRFGRSGLLGELLAGFIRTSPRNRRQEPIGFSSQSHHPE